jgi:hypothetical protein
VPGFLASTMGVLLGIAGCAAIAPRLSNIVGHKVNLYEAYDNSRDWGPSYLVGPPGHHFGDESRIDDSRSAIRETEDPL